MVGISANGKRQSRTEFSQYGNLLSICPNRPKRSTDRFARVNGKQAKFPENTAKTASLFKMAAKQAMKEICSALPIRSFTYIAGYLSY